MGNLERGIITKSKDRRIEAPSAADAIPPANEVMQSFMAPGAEFDRIQKPDFDPEPVINASLEKMQILETAARDTERWQHITPETAASVRRIIVFSAPGTYIDGKKDDRYKDHEWAWGMDRARADRAARLGIVLSGKVSGQDFSSFDAQEPLNANDPKIAGERERAHAAVAASDIRFVYLGRQDEADALRAALNQHNAFIPIESVDIVTQYREGDAEKAIDSTVDQTKALKTYLAETGLSDGESIVFVAHGPQLVRMEGILNKNHSIPPDAAVLFDPLPSADKEYASMEAKGDGYYRGTDQSEGALEYTILGAR